MRSKLFVPGSRPELFSKAFSGHADAISLDLEDSVSPEQKVSARANIGKWLDTLNTDCALRFDKTVIVRINAADSPFHKDDLDACVREGVDLINLPKPYSPGTVQEVSEAVRRLEDERGIEHPIGLLLNIETPAALRSAAALACADERVAGLQLGLADLFEPAGISRNNPSAIAQAMFLLSMAASEAGVYAYDAAFANIGNPEGFKHEAELAKSMGFIGKSCIHPSQIALANTVFLPSESEVALSRRIVQAFEEARLRGQGVCIVDGKMIDAPFVKRARAILAKAAELKSNSST